VNMPFCTARRVPVLALIRSRKTLARGLRVLTDPGGGCLPGHAGRQVGRHEIADATGGVFSRPRSCSALSVRELNADARHVDPLRHRHGARPWSCSPSFVVGIRQEPPAQEADRAGATPDCQVGPGGLLGGVRPPPGSICDPRSAVRGNRAVQHTVPLAHRTDTPGHRSATSDRAPSGRCGRLHPKRRCINIRSAVGALDHNRGGQAVNHAKPAD